MGTETCVTGVRKLDFATNARFHRPAPPPGAPHLSCDGIVMPMTLGLLILQFIGMIALVVATWFVGKRNLGFNWASLGWGALAFPLSQVARFALVIPLQFLFSKTFEPATATALTTALFLVTSGLFEETARWIVLRFWGKNTREWNDGVGFGLGHGGIEALLLFTNLFVGNIMLLTTGDAIKAQATGNDDPATAQAIAEQVEALQNIGMGMIAASWYERALAMVAHVAFTLIVLRAVRERRWLLWALAVVCHIGFNAVAVLVAPHSVPVMYALLTALTALGLWATIDGPLSRKALARTATAEYPDRFANYS